MRACSRGLAVGMGQMERERLQASGGQGWELADTHFCFILWATPTCSCADRWKIEDITFEKLCGVCVCVGGALLGGEFFRFFLSQHLTFFWGALLPPLFEPGQIVDHAPLSSQGQGPKLHQTEPAPN